MPIQSPPWTDFMQCPVCTHEFAANLRAPITLGCGHSICKNCLTTLHRKQCPYDQTEISKNFDNLPINYALLQLTTSNVAQIQREISPAIVKTLTPDEQKCYDIATKCIEELALLLKPSGSVSGLLSRPMQRKLVTLIQCQLLEIEGRARALRGVRSLGERTVTELILQHQNAHQLNTNLWAAVRSRGCQFLGPQMQEEVLKLVLLALEDGSPLSRKILVMYVVQKLEGTYPQASKTSIGHVVQLLYRASCFKVSKREGDSSLMTLKEEFRTYDALRREHDTQIVQIATEAGLRIAPDQWSSLLYGEPNRKSHMQSIIDKQQSPSSFAQSVDELMLALQRTGDPANLAKLRNDLENLSKIDPAMDLTTNTSWNECAEALRAVREVVFGLVDFVQHHGKSKIQESSYNQHASRYKVSFCRELQARGTCARGQNCSFAHSEEELERFRAKNKRNNMRNNIHNNNQLKEIPTSNASASNGPIPKVNTNHQLNYSKCPPNDTANRHNSKQIPYRSENSLHHSSNAIHQQIPQNVNAPPNNHLRPSNAYNSAGSSSSTPNLTQMQLSPNSIIPKASPQVNSRFPFNNNHRSQSKFEPGNFMAANYPLPQPYNHQRPPLSAPPVPCFNKKPNSPYHNTMGPASMVRAHHALNGNGYCSQNQISPTSPHVYRNGTIDNGKYGAWHQTRTSNNIQSPIPPKSAPPVDNCDNLFQQQLNIDEVDSISMWRQIQPIMPRPGYSASSFLFDNSSGSSSVSPSSKEKFIRSDSILATSNNDENYESMTTSGKYGAIGLNKSPDSFAQQQQRQTQWRGLQQSMDAMHNRFDITGTRNNHVGNVLNKNDEHASLPTHPYGGINGNFLNISNSLATNTTSTTTIPTTNDDYWSAKDSSSSSKDLDINALGNGMSVLNILDLINE